MVFTNGPRSLSSTALKLKMNCFYKFSTLNGWMKMILQTVFQYDECQQNVIDPNQMPSLDLVNHIRHPDRKLDNPMDGSSIKIPLHLFGGGEEGKKTINFMNIIGCINQSIVVQYLLLPVESILNWF